MAGVLARQSVAAMAVVTAAHWVVALVPQRAASTVEMSAVQWVVSMAA